MAQSITIQSLPSGDSSEETPVDILTLDNGRVTVGREPENGIVVDSDSVSRQHCCIAEAGSQWVFWDLESTNGSWLNGVKIEGGKIKLLRQGDMIQVADFAMQLAGNVEYSATAPTTILIFFDSDFQTEITLDDSQSSFTIGGDSTFESEGFEQPIATITKGELGLELSMLGTTTSMTLNGVVIGGQSALRDRDEINVLGYRIVINDLATFSRGDVTPGVNAGAVNDVPAYNRVHRPAHLMPNDDDGWESEAARRKTNEGRKFVFGSSPDDFDQTSASLPAVGTEEIDSNSSYGRGLSALHSSTISKIDPEKTVAQKVGIAAGALALIGLFLWALTNMLAI